MLSYRIATVTSTPNSQNDFSLAPTWKWCSPIFVSSAKVLEFLWDNRPHEQMLVLFSSEQEIAWDEMLQYCNDGKVTYSVTAEQFLQMRDITPEEMKRLDMELNAQETADDQPYVFTLPTNVNEVRSWTALMSKVRQRQLAS